MGIIKLSEAGILNSKKYSSTLAGNLPFLPPVGRAISGTGFQLDTFLIPTTGNATSFGTFGYNYYSSALSSSTRGIWTGGFWTATPPSGGAFSTRMEYLTIASTGSTAFFGDIPSGRFRTANLANETRGILAGGGGQTQRWLEIEYLTIATLGNTLDFGNLSLNTENPAAAGSSTRGIIAGGIGGTGTNIIRSFIEYVTIATTGNALSFGDLTVARQSVAALSSSVRLVAGGGDIVGESAMNVMDYVTIATTGNAIDFGDLTGNRAEPGATSNGTRGVFCGGWTGQSASTQIQFITIATTGNATNFGNLTTGGSGDPQAISDSHGGLQ